MRNKNSQCYCTSCKTRIPKNRSFLICSHCDEIKHITCTKLSKTEALEIANSSDPWTCYDCITSALPINACSLPKKQALIGPKFKVHCKCCNGWCYSPTNIRTCPWCEYNVHTRCFSNKLGCKSCCENMIPGYYVSSYQLFENFKSSNDVIHNPYDRGHLINEIGNMFDEEQGLEYWNEISEILVKCSYKQQKNVNMSRSNELKVFSLNVRALLKNIDKLREEIELYSKYDILCFNETNLMQDKLPNGVSEVVMCGLRDFMNHCYKIQHVVEV